MKSFPVAIAALLTFALSGAESFLTLSDATGGAPTGFFMQAAITLSVTGHLNLSMSRKVPSEALPMLERGEVDAVLIDRRFVKNQPYIPLAADALVLYISNANPAVNLTGEQVLEILTARRPNWKSYINIDFDIQRIAPPGNSENLIRRVFGDIEIDREIFQVDSSSAGFAFINTASIFFSRFSPVIPAEVKALNIDGIMPTSETVSNGSYPLAIVYVLAYKELSPKLQALIYTLKQNQFRRLINDCGLLVILEE